jgi:hypothetical protein
MRQKVLLLIATSFLSYGTALAGNEMGNGADNFAGDFGVAWFTGKERTVSFCLDIAPGFGLTADLARTDIQAAWTQWLRYTDAKHLYFNETSDTMKFPRRLDERAGDGKEDLRLRLGAEDTEVAQEKKRYERPTAISYRQSFDAKAGWGKGWIWFCPPGAAEPGFPHWDDGTTFPAILLHEFGHVLGNVHVEGTIMAHGLSQKLYEHRLKKEWLGKIDHTKELLSGGSPERAEGYLGAAGYFDKFRAFEWLMGRKASGAISASFRGVDSSGHLTLSVRDGQGAKDFSLTMKPSLFAPTHSSEVPTFKRMRDGTTSWRYSEGQVHFVTLQHPTLGDVTALLETNMSSTDSIGPFAVKVLIDGLPQPLFAGFPEM